MRVDVLERMAVGACAITPSFRGKTIVGWRLMQRAQRKGTQTGGWPLTLRDGLRLDIPRATRMTWQVAVERSYDAHYINALNQYIEPGTAVLDVEASVGLW